MGFIMLKAVLILLIMAGGIVVRLVMVNKMKAAGEDFKLIELRFQRWFTAFIIGFVLVDCLLTFPNWPRATWLMLGTMAVYGVYCLAHWVVRRNSSTAEPGE